MFSETIDSIQYIPRHNLDLCLTALLTIKNSPFFLFYLYKFFFSKVYQWFRNKVYAIFALGIFINLC